MSGITKCIELIPGPSCQTRMIPTDLFRQRLTRVSIPYLVHYVMNPRIEHLLASEQQLNPFFPDSVARSSSRHGLLLGFPETSKLTWNPLVDLSKCSYISHGETGLRSSTTLIWTSFISSGMPPLIRTDWSSLSMRFQLTKLLFSASDRLWQEESYRESKEQQLSIFASALLSMPWQQPELDSTRRAHTSLSTQGSSGLTFEQLRKDLEASTYAVPPMNVSYPQPSNGYPVDYSCIWTLHTIRQQVTMASTGSLDSDGKTISNFLSSVFKSTKSVGDSFKRTHPQVAFENCMARIRMTTDLQCSQSPSGRYIIQWLELLKPAKRKMSSSSRIINSWSRVLLELARRGHINSPYRWTKEGCSDE